MKQVETIHDFYKNHLAIDPPAPNPGVGHFNVFQHAPFIVDPSKRAAYQRRDYFKIMLAFGTFRISYADQVFDVKKQALLFCNPQIPYQIDGFDCIESVVYCLFSYDFFLHFGQLSEFWVFQPGTRKVFELTDEETKPVQEVFAKMLEEIETEYVYKYELLRSYTHELTHLAMKMEPTISKVRLHSASQRITNLFLELLERQFPIDETHRLVRLKSASDFALQLNVHVNHLNRTLKLTTGKTSTEIIADRLIQEARILLRQSDSNISEIGLALGFEDLAYFSNFFKKHTHLTPMQYRNI